MKERRKPFQVAIIWYFIKLKKILYVIIKYCKINFYNNIFSSCFLKNAYRLEHFPIKMSLNKI